MSAAVAYALMSLACAGLTDVIFKRYSQIARSRGLYVLGIGVTWTILQAAIVLAAGAGVRLDAQTAAFGLVAGLLVAMSNTLLIESLTHIEVGLGSTIYRLNTIAVVMMAVFLLGEPMTGVKLAGVFLGVAAVIVLFEREHGHSEARSVFLLCFGLVVLASLLRACFAILSKFAVLRGVDLQTMLAVNAPVWVAVGAIYAWGRNEKLQMTGSTVAYSVISGILICGVANFLMLAVERGDASVVVPIANMSFLVAILLLGALGIERLTRRRLIAVGLAISAIVTLAQT